MQSVSFLMVENLNIEQKRVGNLKINDFFTKIDK